MNCPRCSAELPDSAQSCSRCGFQVRPTSFSYLAAGSPPWPMTASEGFPYMRGSNAPGTQTTLPMQKPADVPAAKSAGSSKKSTLGVPLIIALFFVSILIGGGGTLGILYTSGRFPSNGNSQAQRPVTLNSTPGAGLTPTPATTPGSQLPTPSSFLMIKSNDLGVSLKYPQGWIAGSPQTTSSGNTSIDIHPQQQLTIDFIIGRISASNSAQISSTNDINQANLAQFQGAQGVTNFQLVQPTSPQRSIGGLQWDEQDATFDASGMTLHVTTISGHHNKLYYNMLFYVPDPNYTEAIQKYFQPMFDSFKFLS